jgi:hypothetical protein
MWMRSCAVCRALPEKTQVDRYCPLSVRMGVGRDVELGLLMETDEWKG